LDINQTIFHNVGTIIAHRKYGTCSQVLQLATIELNQI